MGVILPDDRVKVLVAFLIEESERPGQHLMLFYELV